MTKSPVNGNEFSKQPMIKMMMIDAMTQSPSSKWPMVKMKMRVTIYCCGSILINQIGSNLISH